MQYLVDLLFSPPLMPPVHLPWPSHLLPGIQGAVTEVFRFAYYRGVYDGFVAGVLLYLLLAPHVRQSRG